MKMHSSIRYSGADRPWLLLVHGMLTNARHWLPNRGGLGRHFNLVQVDLPGHGNSPPPAEVNSLTADSLIGGLDRIRTELGIGRWYVCGQSFGAGLTLNYARRYPDRVVAQAFTNARVVLRENDSPQERASRLSRLETLRREGVAALRREHFHPRFARRFRPDLRDMLCADAERIDMPTYTRILGEVMPSLSLRHVVDSAPNVPTLLVNGRHERAFQPFRAELAAIWPRMRIVDLDGGHSINIENPEGFNAALIDFFTGHAIFAEGPNVA
ncbi:pimeloyl-ACP methyl ester carboxylesterase [Pseudochelatococcus lubricantis]|uniref:Pimeloyl-ACP methyl ester carboxylesterase n=1 Tax=Pseudochelatococcus lubricantis TaxID=1538102 RepID=A0ABX0V563_9HYPH|nr:alpha/beta fold hydrolase [Pseudochelatococcus lubricantis]NIJ58915.1 pimeloyl-ACP methyl ester carboxylesterase [Pseudochelatococcus lubricantis]